MPSKLGKILVARNNDACVLKMIGDIRVNLCSSMDQYVESIILGKYNSIVIDVREAVGIDSTSLGILAKLSLYAQRKFSIKPVIFSTNDSITKLLMSVGFDKLFDLQVVPCGGDLSFSELQFLDEKHSESESIIRKRVLEAHKVLMSLNAGNKNKFKELVSKLERES